MSARPRGARPAAQERRMRRGAPARADRRCPAGQPSARRRAPERLARGSVLTCALRSEAPCNQSYRDRQQPHKPETRNLRGPWDLMAQVLMSTAAVSGSIDSAVGSYPLSCRMRATSSESETFIWRLRSRRKQRVCICSARGRPWPAAAAARQALRAPPSSAHMRPGPRRQPRREPTGQRAARRRATDQGLGCARLLTWQPCVMMCTLPRDATRPLAAVVPSGEALVPAAGPSTSLLALLSPAAALPGVAWSLAARGCCAALLMPARLLLLVVLAQRRSSECAPSVCTRSPAAAARCK